MTTKELVLDSLMEKMTTGGLWCIGEASEAMKNHVKKTSPKNYLTEIKKYETLQKFIDTGRNIIVVSLTELDWGGICSYSKNEISFLKDTSKIIFRRNMRAAVEIVSISDHQIPSGEIEIPTTMGNIIKTQVYQTAETFYKALVETGYVSQEEIDNYLNKTINYELPLIKIVSM